MLTDLYSEVQQILTLSAVNDAIAVTATVIDVVLCALWRQWDLTRQTAPALRALAAVVSTCSSNNPPIVKSCNIAATCMFCMHRPTKNINI